MNRAVHTALLVFFLWPVALGWGPKPATSPADSSAEERLKQAGALVEKSHWKAAEEILNPLLAELRERRDDQRAASASFLLARARAAQGNYESAITLDESLLKFYQETSNAGALVEVHNHLGSIYSSLGKSQPAEAHFAKALETAEPIKNTNGILVAVNGLAGVYADRRDFDKSLAFYKRAMELSEATGNKRRLAAALQNTGLLYAGVGDYSRAFDYFDRARGLYKELNNPALLARLLVNLSAIDIEVGEYPKAQEAANEAYRVAHENQLSPLEMLALHNRGRSLHYRGDYKGAIENYQAAIALAQTIQDQRNEADLLNSLGETYFRLGDFKMAARYHQRALEEVRGFHLPAFTGLFLRNVAGDYVQAQEPDRAIEVLKEALRVAEDTKDRRLKGFAANDLGLIFYEKGDGEKAREYFSQALAVRREIGDRRGEAETLAHLGLREYRAKRLEAAGQYFEEAISIARAIGHAETLWRAEYGAALVMRDLNKKAEAIATLVSAVDGIEQIRRSVLGNARAEAMFFANKQAVYEMLIELLVETGDTEKAFEYLERSKSKLLQDKIKLTSIPFKNARVRGLMSEAEDLFDVEAGLQKQLLEERAKNEALKNPQKIEHLTGLLASNKAQFFRVVNDLRQIHPDYERFVTVKPPSLAKIQRLIPADTLVLEYFPSESQLYIFEMTSADFKLRSVPVAREELNALVKSYRGEMHGTVERLRARLLTRTRRLRGPSPADASEPSMPHIRAAVTALYNHLIAPVESDLASKKTLTIIPAGLLYYLPFQALAKDEKGELKYLIESKAISYLSSSDLFELAFAKRSHEDREHLVAFGNPDGTLPSALDEVERLKRIFPNSRVYMLWEAKKERLFDLPQGTELLHLATHGRLNSADLNDSYIKLASEGAGDLGKLKLSEIYDLPLDQTSLVTLSACETALGEKDPGTEIASLAQAFSIAGAPTVVASLWAVYDPSTADMMDSFYRELHRGTPKAEALQHAQVAILHNPKYSNPYFWAPFIMLGDWR